MKEKKKVSLAQSILDKAYKLSDGHSQVVYDAICRDNSPEAGGEWNVFTFKFSDGSRIIATREGYMGPGNASPGNWSFVVDVEKPNN